jgi:hypothetical protein
VKSPGREFQNEWARIKEDVNVTIWSKADPERLAELQQLTTDDKPFRKRTRLILTRRSRIGAPAWLLEWAGVAEPTDGFDERSLPAHISAAGGLSPLYTAGIYRLYLYKIEMCVEGYCGEAGLDGQGGHGTTLATQRSACPWPLLSRFTSAYAARSSRNRRERAGSPPRPVGPDQSTPRGRGGWPMGGRLSVIRWAS